jgi:hypothetical protein
VDTERKTMPSKGDYEAHCSKCKHDLFGECDLMKDCVRMGFTLFEQGGK